MCIIELYRIRGTRYPLGLMGPIKCFKSHLRDVLVHDELLKLISKSLESIGVVEGIDPFISGIAWIGETPLCSNCHVLEFVRGVYDIKVIKYSSQCIFTKDKLIGCRFKDQRTLINCECRELEISKLSLDYLIDIIKTVVKTLREDHRMRSSSAFLWMYYDGKVVYWEL